jgi:hypothetical protein
LVLLGLLGCAAGPQPGQVPIIDRSIEAAPSASGTQTQKGDLPPPASAGQPITRRPLTPEARDDISTNTHPGVVALLDTAGDQQQAGHLSEAAANLERALRIEPRNAITWYRLGVIRFRQARLEQAEQLARKADALAGHDTLTRARSWQLIANVREQAGDSEGAQAAWEKAQSLPAKNQ